MNRRLSGVIIVTLALFAHRNWGQVVLYQQDFNNLPQGTLSASSDGWVAFGGASTGTFTFEAVIADTGLPSIHNWVVYSATSATNTGVSWFGGVARTNIVAGPIGFAAADVTLTFDRGHGLGSAGGPNSANPISIRISQSSGGIETWHTEWTPVSTGTPGGFVGRLDTGTQLGSYSPNLGLTLTLSFGSGGLGWVSTAGSPVPRVFLDNVKLTAVPEPSAVLLACVGLAVCQLLLRNRH